MIAVITASPRPQSRSAIVANALSDVLIASGIEVKHFRMQEMKEDLAYFMVHGEQIGKFRSGQEELMHIEKMVFVVPEYNGSFPGILKFWIDSSRFPHTFAGKKAALVGLGDGMFGNVRGLDQLASVLNYCQMAVMPFRMHLPRIGNRLQNGPLQQDTDFIQQAEKFASQLKKF